VIARTRTDTCPVAMLECYIRRVGIVRLDSEGMIFRAFVSGKTEKLRDSGGLLYSRMRELLKEKLPHLGFRSTLQGRWGNSCS